MNTKLIAKITLFFRQYPRVSFKKGVVIFGGHVQTNDILYIEKGYVRQYILSRGGEEQTMLLYGPSDILSLVWAMLGERRKHRLFETITPASLRFCPKSSFLAFLDANPAVSFMIMQQSLEQFDDLLQLMAYLSLSTKTRIKILVLLILLSKRFGKKRVVGDMPFPLTHQDIAFFLGIARETVSIAMKKLIDTGFVVQKEHMLSLGNMKKLREESVLSDLLD